MKLNNESLKSFEQAKTFSEHASKVNGPDCGQVSTKPYFKIFLGEFIIIFI